MSWIKLLKGLGLRLKVWDEHVFFSPMYHGNHWLWNGGHGSLGPQIKFKWIQPGKHWGLFFQVHSGKGDFLIGELKKSNTYIGKSWFTLNLIAGIFAEPRRLFFMTAFSRGEGRNFSHNWKRHLFQPQSGSRYITWFGALRPLISTSTKQFPSWPCVHLVAELLRADQTVQICPGPLRTRWCLQDSYVGLYLQ